MEFFKLFISFLGIVLISFLAYEKLAQEKIERELSKSQKISEAEIINLSCGKTKYIKFVFGGEVIAKRIYISKDECSNLANEAIIKLKVDEIGNIVFAEESYNDWSEAESVSTILLAMFFIFCIFWYSIKPIIMGLRGK